MTVDGQLTIIVRPSTRAYQHLGPLAAYIAGTSIEGHGRTVFEAIEDLFTCREAGRVAGLLEREVAEREAL